MTGHLYFTWSTFIDTLAKNRILRNVNLCFDYKKKGTKKKKTEFFSSQAINNA